ncbi:hypothetical protein LINPERHAP2_LOCUS14286 [Linum perenne]
MICLTGKKRGSSKGKKITSTSSVRGMEERVRILEEEIEAIMYKREKESRAYERDVMVCAFKEAEWKQEKKKLKEEVKKLRKVVEEKEERIRRLECGILQQDKSDMEGDNNWLLSGTATTFLLHQMREERALRDEAVDKWKKLYLAIKSELDDLIQNTHPGRQAFPWSVARLTFNISI